jgi:hypothetical protein
LLRDFRTLGARALELTGGGNPLLYRDRETGEGINNLLIVAARMRYQVGIITNSESLAAITPAQFPFIAWVRISLAKLEEGRVASDYDLRGFPEERVGFSWVLHEKSPPDMLKKVQEVADRFPKTRFFRTVADCTKPGSHDTAAQQWPLLMQEVADVGQRWYLKENCSGEPFEHSCTVGLVRPYVAAPPAGAADQEYKVYTCTSHVLQRQNYDTDYALCNVSDVLHAWPAMWRAWLHTGFPYEVRNNGGRGWRATCGSFCFYGENNRLLHDVVSPPADAAFA